MPMPTSYRALCQALLLIAAITFQCIPLPGTAIVFARIKKGGQSKAPGSNQSKATARPQRTPVPNGVPAVNITATLRDAFPNHGDGMAHAGDVITYTVTITNSGDTDATGVVFDDIVDINTSTLVPSSAAISPIISSDSYSALGNTPCNAILK